MVEIIFSLIFPIVLVGLLIIIFISGFAKKKQRKSLNFMNLDEFMRDWLNDHGQGHKLEEQLIKMKKDPMGGLYMPITYKGGKIFTKWGLSANLCDLNLPSAVTTLSSAAGTRWTAWYWHTASCFQFVL